MFLLAHLIEKNIQRLDPKEFALNLECVSKVEKILEISERNGCKKSVATPSRDAEKKLPLHPQFPSPFIMRVNGCVAASAYWQIIRIEAWSQKKIPTYASLGCEGRIGICILHCNGAARLLGRHQRTLIYREI